jgi:selenocysteine lyase/cysteine desulfurase
VAQNKVKYGPDGTTLAWEHREHPTKSNTVQLNGPKFLGKYTITTKGQSKDSGWTKEARKLFVKWTEMCRKARKSEAGRALEKVILDKIRDEEHIVAWNPDEERARKRRKTNAERAAEPAESDVDMNYDSEDLEEDSD